MLSHNQPPTEHKESGDTELDQTIDAAVSWYDPTKHHGCEVPEVCKQGMRERFHRLIAQSHTQFLQEIEEAIGPDQHEDSCKWVEWHYCDCIYEKFNEDHARIRNILESKRT